MASLIGDNLLAAFGRRAKVFDPYDDEPCPDHLLVRDKPTARQRRKRLSASVVNKPYLNEHEAAAILDVSNKTIRRMIADRRLPATDCGRGVKHLWRIAAADLKAVARLQPQAQTPQDQLPTSDPLPATNAPVPQPKRSRRRTKTSTAHLPAA
jgi:excisionase family DNA binding protein